MTPRELADLHARGFTDHRPWDAKEFADLLQSPLTHLIGQTDGFALIRVVADEAELLTIVTLPEKRRQGLGRNLLTGAAAKARANGAEKMFLEVAVDNEAAVRLYQSFGFVESGRRRGYYPRSTGPHADAVVMSVDLPT